jgi:hypothetical protein
MRELEKHLQVWTGDFSFDRDIWEQVNKFFKNRPEVEDFYGDSPESREGGKVHQMGTDESEYIDNDFCIVPPDTDTHMEGMFVVYLDDGLLPQVYEVECVESKTTGPPHGSPYVIHGAVEYTFEPWLIVDYLIGEDLDPVSIIVDKGDEFEVIAYRRCEESKERPYQEGWVGEVVPEEYRETAPPTRTRKRRPGVSARFNDGPPGGWDGRKVDYRKMSESERRKRGIAHVTRDGQGVTGPAYERQHMMFLNDRPITAHDLRRGYNFLKVKDFCDWVDRYRQAGHDMYGWRDIVCHELATTHFSGLTKNDITRQQILSMKAELQKMFERYDNGAYDNE